MRPENRKMKKYLSFHNINATPKYLWTGSLKGCWRLYNYKMKWYGNKGLQTKLSSLGFNDFDNKPLTDLSGNGGKFQIFARNKKCDILLNEGNTLCSGSYSHKNDYLSKRNGE